MKRSILIAVVAAVVGVLVAGVVGFTILSSRIDSVRHDTGSAATIASLKTQLNVQKTELAVEKTNTARIKECLPEIQAQINGLNINTEWQSIYGVQALTSAYIQNNQQVSASCAKVLQKNTGPGND